MKHIVFIGLPGCGKTTVAKLTASALGLPWQDSDRLIEATEQLSIPLIFAQKGEAYFRERETECIRKLLEGPRAVISVGGGAVLYNGELLAAHSTVVYLRRRIDRIVSTLDSSNRPLFHSHTDASVRLNELYEQRRTLYEKLGNVHIDNEGSVDDTVQTVTAFLTCMSK